MSEDAAGYIVHWAGTAVRHRSLVRQRCMWCGALIMEVDVDRIAWQGDWPNPFVEDDGTPKSQWEPGALVAVAGDPNHGQGGAMWVVDEPDDRQAPPESCMAIHPAATA